MRLTWPVGNSLRSFYDPNSHRLTIVSDLVDDKAEGRVYGSRLAIAFSRDGEFRDLELIPGPLVTLFTEAEVPVPSDVDDPVVVWIPDAEKPVFEASPDSAEVTIRLASAEPKRWVRLRGSGVVLGLVDEDVLAAIRVEPEVDPDGEREARWLDSLGA